MFKILAVQKVLLLVTTIRVGEGLSLGDFYAEVYGNPSEQLLKATAGLQVKVYSFYQGI